MSQRTADDFTTTNLDINKKNNNEQDNHNCNHHHSYQLQEWTFLQELPKVELHAHLNGCIRPTTLFALAMEKGVTLSKHHYYHLHNNQNNNHHVVDNDNDDHHNNDTCNNTVHLVDGGWTQRSLQDCFQMFAEIPFCVNDVDALRRITWETLEDFAKQHVAYLELRTTPKVLRSSSRRTSTTTTTGNNDDDDDVVVHVCNKQLYLETVLSVMEQFEQKQGQNNNDKKTVRMICRLIVSIDRSLSEQEAMENVDLAITFRQNQKYSHRIVGMDLGGNPTCGNFSTFQPHLERARCAGLSITLHCGEIPYKKNDHHPDDDDDNEEEVQAMLKFQPNRLGHVLFIPSSSLSLLSELCIPIETCPTSNVMTMELVQKLSQPDEDIISRLKQDHPQLSQWLDTNYPITIGTDDPGIFDTTCTRELWLLCRAYDLTMSQISRLVLQSMNYAFCNDALKQSIQHTIQQHVNVLLEEWERKIKELNGVELLE